MRESTARPLLMVLPLSYNGSPLEQQTAANSPVWNPAAASSIVDGVAAEAQEIDDLLDPDVQIIFGSDHQGQVPDDRN
jgi:hypothetical protein